MGNSAVMMYDDIFTGGKISDSVNSLTIGNDGTLNYNTTNLDSDAFLDFSAMLPRETYMAKMTLNNPGENGYDVCLQAISVPQASLSETFLKQINMTMLLDNVGIYNGSLLWNCSMIRYFWNEQKPASKHILLYTVVFLCIITFCNVMINQYSERGAACPCHCRIRAPACYP